MIKSKKFLFTEMLDSTSPFFDYVPKTWQVFDHEGDLRPLFNDEIPYILRSALLNENTEKEMNSGKSYSKKDLYSISDFEAALKIASAQKDLDKIVLQLQFQYEFHLSVYVQDDLFLFQYKKDDEKECSLASMTPAFQSGHFPYFHILEKFYDQWMKQGFKDGYVLEMGVTSKEIKLFQANVLPVHLISRVFNDDLFIKLISSRENFKKRRSLFILLKMEIDARSFRSKELKKSQSNVSLAFKNWEFLFHYFYLFCQLKKKSGLDQDFVDFLNFSQKHKENWLALIIHQHLKLSGTIREGEEVKEMPAIFKTQGSALYFLGTDKVIEGKLKDIGEKIEFPTPEYMYKTKPDKIVFTPSREILGHAFLVAAEKSIHVVANFERNTWENLSPEDYLIVNFNLKSLVIKILEGE